MNNFENKTISIETLNFKVVFNNCIYVVLRTMLSKHNISKVVKNIWEYSAVVYNHYWEEMLLKSLIPFWYHD